MSPVPQVVTFGGTMHTAMTEVTTRAQLREALGGAPKRSLINEVRDRLDGVDREWLGSSPFCLMATAGADGSCDVSPRGDAPGFALVLDESTLVLPERAGNRRGDGYANLLENNHVGLLFMIPGRTDTLRVNGSAKLVSDAPFFEELSVAGQLPVLALVVQVEEVFYHCVKAFHRSGLWRPETWRPLSAPSRGRVLRSLEDSRDLAELDPLDDRPACIGL
jgi:PPOX class probable FMN-dependent enzyme